jgi:hypothetical protein
MDLLDTIQVGTGRIELLHGDLSALPAEHAVDLLMLSAFPNGYHPTGTSLIGALHRRGLVLRGLANDKEIDLRKNFSCWISKPIREEFRDLNFGRILCFEPLVRGAAPSVVAEVFQALAPFVCGPTSIRSVAMPILAAGDQGNPVSKMLPPLLDAAVHWLAHGLPLKVIKVVIRTGTDAGEARALFDAAKRNSRIVLQEAQKQTAPAFDVFISYARPDVACAESLKEGLAQVGLSAFLDRAELKAGSVWQQEIFDAMEACRATAVLYSPDYLASPVCREEFTIGWTRQRDGEALMFPLLVRETGLPPHMRMLSYVDCRPSDVQLTRAAATTLHDQLRNA